MKEAHLVIKNKTGLHARPASEFVKLVNLYPDSKITITKEQRMVDAKSILNIMSLGLNCNSKIVLQVDGGNEEAIIHKLVSFIEDLEG